MVDVLSIVRALLVADAALVALVPAARMIPSGLTSTVTFPCLVYRETNNFLQSEDYLDNVPKYETTNILFDIYQNPGISTTPIALALDSVMIGAGWNRESSGVILDDTGRQHRVANYSTRLFVDSL